MRGRGLLIGGLLSLALWGLGILLALTLVHVGFAGGNHCAGMTNGVDIWYGTPFGDICDGYGGNDTMSGKQGADDLDGGPGDDSVQGNAGNDDLRGNGGTNHLYGSDGDDEIWDVNGGVFSTIQGGPGFDVCHVDFDESLGRADDTSACELVYYNHVP